MNPIEMIKSFIGKGGNPQQLLMKAIQGNDSNPMISNLIQMAQNGNFQGVEKFARNYFNERGRNFDEEYAAFLKQIK